MKTYNKFVLYLMFAIAAPLWIMVTKFPASNNNRNEGSNKIDSLSIALSKLNTKIDSMSSRSCCDSIAYIFLTLNKLEKKRTISDKNISILSEITDNYRVKLNKVIDTINRNLNRRLDTIPRPLKMRFIMEMIENPR